MISHAVAEDDRLGGNCMNQWTGLLVQIERYRRTQNNEDLCNDSADLIDFIETVRDDELIRRMEQADDK